MTELIKRQLHGFSYWAGKAHRLQHTARSITTFMKGTAPCTYLHQASWNSGSSHAEEGWECLRAAPCARQAACQVVACQLQVIQSGECARSSPCVRQGTRQRLPFKNDAAKCAATGGSGGAAKRAEHRQHSAVQLSGRRATHVTGALDGTCMVTRNLGLTSAPPAQAPTCPVPGWHRAGCPPAHSSDFCTGIRASGT